MNEYKPSILKKEENTIYDKYASLQVKYHTLNTEKETLEQIIKKDCKMIEMLEHIIEKSREANEKLQKENKQLKELITSMGFTIEKENGTITRVTKEIKK